MQIQHGDQAGNGSYLGAIHCHDDVPAFGRTAAVRQTRRYQAHFVRWAAAHDLGDVDPVVHRQVQGLHQQRFQGGGGDTQPGRANHLIFFQPGQKIHQSIDGDGESDTAPAQVSGIEVAKGNLDRGIDSHHFALAVQQRSARVPRIDQRVGL